MCSQYSGGVAAEFGRYTLTTAAVSEDLILRFDPLLHFTAPGAVRSDKAAQRVGSGIKRVIWTVQVFLIGLLWIYSAVAFDLWQRAYTGNFLPDIRPRRLRRPLIDLAIIQSESFVPQRNESLLFRAIERTAAEITVGDRKVRACIVRLQHSKLTRCELFQRQVGVHGVSEYCLRHKRATSELWSRGEEHNK